jgi:hypothetical protein
MKTIAAIAAITVAFVVQGHAQSLTGKWFGQAADGGAIGLDLTQTGSTLTGTFIVIRAGQSIPLPIQDATLTGETLTFRVAAGNESAAFTAERAGDRITLRALAPAPTGPPIVLSRVDAFPDAALSPLATTTPASAPAGWRASNRAATIVEEAGRRIVRVDARLGDGVIWQEGAELRNGTIEVDIRGANRPGESFVGITFHGANDTTYEGVYFRPFNFRAEPPGRDRAVQYISHPEYPWARLREEHPGQYERAVSPVPDPDGWFHARVVVSDRTVRVFVNEASAPTMTVDTLTPSRGGMVGLWVGNGSSGDFANLRVTPAD